MIHGHWPGLFWVYLIRYVFKILVFEEFLSHELDLHHFHFVSVQSVQEVRQEAPPLRFLFHHMFLISTLEFTSKHTQHIWVHHYMFDLKTLFFCPSQLWCEGVREMQGLGLKTLEPTDDEWTAGATADSATGGAGFTQQGVGVWALLLTQT